MFDERGERSSSKWPPRADEEEVWGKRNFLFAPPFYYLDYHSINYGVIQAAILIARDTSFRTKVTALSPPPL